MKSVHVPLNECYNGIGKPVVKAEKEGWEKKKSKGKRRKKETKIANESGTGGRDETGKDG